MELVNELLPTINFRNVDTTFWKDSSHERGLLTALPLTGHSLHKAEMEYHDKFVHTLGRIQNIYLMSRMDLFNATCNLANQTMAPTLPGLQGIKSCVQYLYNNPHKPIFILLIIMTNQM